jgi:hypothetical protein
MTINQAQADYEMRRAAADEPKHTATPWHADKSKSLCGIYSDALPPAVPHWPFDPFVATASTEANAAFIVRACNEYDALTKTAAEYAWLKDCARKTGVTVRFAGENMVVGHGIVDESVVDDLVKALRFYADRERYNGPNQRLDGADEYTPMDQVYLQDVSRDNGDLARSAIQKAGA